jgi:hypothetical protein
MNTFCVIAVLLCLNAAYSQELSIHDCSTGTSIFSIDSLIIFPKYPLPNENATIQYAYNAPLEITSGTSKYMCTLNGLTVFSETYSLCSDEACPITVGTHDYTYSFQIPSIAGKAVCRIEWLSDTAEQLLCIETIIKSSYFRF